MPVWDSRAAQSRPFLPAIVKKNESKARATCNSRCTHAEWPPLADNCKAVLPADETHIDSKVWLKKS